MKYFVAVFACALLATALAAVDEEKVKDIFRKFKQAHEDCNNDPATHVDFEAFRKAHGKKEDVPNYGAHSFCVSKKLGWQNADGSVNEAEILSKIDAIVDKSSKLGEVRSKCTQSQGSPEATAAHLLDCLFEHAPHPSGTHQRRHDH